MFANLLIDRNEDVIKAVADSRMRDIERDIRRREAEEARRLEKEIREQRKKFNINEVQQVSLAEDEKILKAEGDQALFQLRSSGRSVYVDDAFDFETAKGGFQNENEITYIRVEEMVSSVNDTPGQITSVFSDGVSAGDIM